jgi:transcriptional regulator with XRE-family HTH domain
MPDHAAENLSRLMAERGLTIKQVVQQTGLDDRTIKAILSGTSKPQARTLHRLAQGLGVSADEFFVDPAQLLYRRFDRDTNPLVGEVLENQRELFAGWTQADFDELHSRFGTGGPLTYEGTVAAVGEMNRRRSLHEKLALLLETSHAELVAGILELMYERVTLRDG